MPHTDAANSDLFELVHRLLTASSAAHSGGDRRKEVRRTYPRSQLLAPMVRDRMPTMSMFLPVSCCDISSHGLSFLMPQPPGFQQLVAALGEAAERVYIAAKIVNYKPVETRGGRMYRVGCRFVGRIESDQIEDDRVMMPPGTPVERRLQPR